MPTVKSLTFFDSRGDKRQVDFVSQLSPEQSPAFQITIVTGHNGSYKSTMLKELVAALTLPESASTVSLRDKGLGPHHVLCTSGSVADRFPPKDLPAGGRSRFDVPNYSYIGQRAGPNILSKKAPVETMLSFALDGAKASRFSADFFLRAHHLAGIEPKVEFTFQRRQKKTKDGPDLLGRVQKVLPEVRQNPSERRLPEDLPISYATAQWLLDEFEYEDFTALEHSILRGGKRPKATLSENGIQCDSPSALRLGLYLGLITLSEARVNPIDSNSSFSLFDLSSGEYHMYSTILGLGFGMQESSLVLIDEPENSLHPQWQREFMDAVIKICEETLMDGHLVVCTHSPLIVATAPEGSTVVDLTLADSQVSVTRFGASADELLLTQFGIGSSRNQAVVAAVQRAVSLVERGEFDEEKSRQMEPELRKVLEALSVDDPLVPVIKALLSEGVDEDEPRL